MTDFPTQYTRRERVRAAAGTSIHQLYSPRYDKSGRLELVPNGTEDIYPMIQSHKDSVDINVLLARYNNGEVDALSRVQGAYGDFTGYPATYAELLNRVIEGEHAFMQLPVDVREKFDHSPTVWMSQIGTDDWFSRMGVSRPEPVPQSTPAPEVNPDEP